MVELTIRVDPRVVNAALTRFGKQVEPRLQKVTRSYADRTITLIRRNASGRPGPNAPTGDYKRTWSKRANLGNGYTVGTDAPQARRLEKGFTGYDSLGRFYQQKAYPHLAPAVRTIRPLYHRAITEEIRKMIREAA